MHDGCDDKIKIDGSEPSLAGKPLILPPGMTFTAIAPLVFVIELGQECQDPTDAQIERIKSMALAALPPGSHVLVTVPGMNIRQLAPEAQASAMVRIHEGLYLDAAKVVSVQMFVSHGSIPCVEIVWRGAGEKCAANVIRCGDMDQARKLARRIRRRVNRGRFLTMKVDDMEVPVSVDQVPRDKADRRKKERATRGPASRSDGRAEQLRMGFTCTTCRKEFAGEPNFVNADRMTCFDCSVNAPARALAHTIARPPTQQETQAMAEAAHADAPDLFDKDGRPRTLKEVESFRELRAAMSEAPRRSRSEECAALKAQVAFHNLDTWQKQMLHTKAAMSLVNGARQVGKTTALVQRALQQLRRRNQVVMVLAPGGSNERRIKDLWRVIANLAVTDPKVIVGNELLCGVCTIERKVDLLVIDDAAYVDDETISAALSCLKEDGAVVAVSTPRSAKGWFYRQWHDQFHGERFFMPAVKCPRISREFLADLARTMSDRAFRQEWLAEFLAPTAMEEVCEHATGKLMQGAAQSLEQIISSAHGPKARAESLVFPSDSRCCLLDAQGQQCPNRSEFWVGSNGMDDYTHVCGEHVVNVVKEGDSVHRLRVSADGTQRADDSPIGRIDGYSKLSGAGKWVDALAIARFLTQQETQWEEEAAEQLDRSFLYGLDVGKDKDFTAATAITVKAVGTKRFLRKTRVNGEQLVLESDVDSNDSADWSVVPMPAPSVDPRPLCSCSSAQIAAGGCKCGGR